MKIEITGKKYKKTNCISFISAVFLLLSFLFFYCQTAVEIDVPEHRSKLTVNGIFTVNQNWRVYLGQSISIVREADRNSLTQIENALVEIQEGDNTICTLNYVGSGIYIASSPRPLPGRRYTVNVFAPGFPNITASDEIPARVQISSVDYDRTILYNSRANKDFVVHFKDPPDRENFYRFSIIGRRVNNEDYDRINFKSTDPVFKGEELNLDFEDLGGSILFSYFDDGLFSGENYSIKVSLDLNQQVRYNQIFIEFFSISEAYYRYIKSVSVFGNNVDNPFTEPFRIFNNIENGYGIFAGYYEYYYSVIR